MSRGRSVSLFVVLALSLAPMAAAQMDGGGTLPAAPPPAPPTPSLPSDASVTTEFTSNNAFCGNTFDLESTAEVDLVGFDVNVGDPSSGAGGATVDVDVYWKLGTAVGSEANMADWTLLGTATVTAAGQDAATEVPVGGLTLMPGQVYGIYITVQDPDCTAQPGAGVVFMWYTDGGPNAYTDGTVTVTTNSGQGNPPFNSVFFPRIWNGTVFYDIAGVPTLPAWATGLLVVTLLGLGALVLRGRMA